MAEEEQPSRLKRFLLGAWEALKGLSVPITACAAFFASLTALGVYEGDYNRHQFEKLRHSYEMHLEFVRFVSAQRSLLPCYQALNELSESDLKSVLSYDLAASFEFNPSRHGSLVECLVESVTGTTTPEQWGPFQTRLVRSAVMRRIAVIDATLLSYRHKIGDPGVICENFRGYIHGGVINRYLKRIIAADIIGLSSYPNLIDFFEQHGNGQPCPDVRLPQLKPNPILEWYRNLLATLAGEGPLPRR